MHRFASLKEIVTFRRSRRLDIWKHTPDVRYGSNLRKRGGNNVVYPGFLIVYLPLVSHRFRVT